MLQHVETITLYDMFLKRKILVILLLILTTSFLPAQTPTPSASLGQGPTPDPVLLMVARLRAAKAANKPFTIWCADGLKFPVADATCIALHPPSETLTNVVVFSGADTISMIPLHLITNITTP